MENCIIIKRPKIERISGKSVRLTADILEPGKPIFHSFIEVEEEYAEYLTYERSDYLLCLVFPVAIRTGFDIVCEAPVTETLLHNINEILIPHYLLGDKTAKKFKIYADAVSEKIGGNAVGTAVSCGVDSTYTIMEYTKDKYKNMKLSHLFIASVSAELWDFDEEVDTLDTWEKKHKEAFERYNTVSEILELPLVKMYTNIIWYVCKRNWELYHHLYVHHYITMASVLSLRKLWGIYYFSSAEDYTNFSMKDCIRSSTELSALLIMHSLSLQDFLCFSGGVSADRIEKTKLLSDYEVAQKTLHPCHKQGKKNCSAPWCHKCTRALFTFDYYDKLDKMADVFDIDRYKKDKKTYFWWLAHNRKDEFMKPLYIMMCEKYPESMRKATESYEKWSKPIPREEYDVLKYVYNVSLKLCKFHEPSKIVLSFFKEKEIKKLYCSGTSNFGTMILSMIDNYVKCLTYKNANVLECDAVYILSTRQNEIEDLKKRLKTDKPVYTIKDIDEYISNIKI